jgi:prepilin-type processing-associated H-X9-DG protein
MRTKRNSGRVRAAFTILELIVTASIVGVLVALLLPALLSAREAARRLQCSSHLRELGLAAQQFHNSSRRLPAAWSQTPDHTTGYGWALDVLPFLEETAISVKVARQVPITSAQNEGLGSHDLPMMRCPSDIAEPTFELFEEPSSSLVTNSAKATSPVVDGGPLVRLPIANYVGVYGTLEADESIPAPNGDGSIVVNRRVRLSDLQRGTSHTYLIGERTAAMAPATWFGVSFLGEDAACRLVGSAITSPNCDACDECELASRHAGGANFAWADGHVSLIADEIDSAEYQRLSKRN